MKEIEALEETEAILLVDATNAFNTINRQAALHNIKVICPAMSTVLNNTCTKPIRLFVSGGEISSMEGITQGDPLAMAMYALAITPLIKKIKTRRTRCKASMVCRRLHCRRKIASAKKLVASSHNYGSRLWILPDCQ